MKFTRTAGLGLAAAVLVAGGVTAALVAGTHSAGADKSATSNPASSQNAPGAGATDPGATPSTPPTTPPGPGPRVKVVEAKAPPLTPAQLQYHQQTWGDPKTEVGIIIQAPKTWPMVKLSTFEVRFSSPNKLWNLRVNASASDLPVKTIADREQTVASSSTHDYRLISRVDGTTKATNPNFSGIVFDHTTLTYSYTDPDRGARLVVQRFVSLKDTPHTLFELAAGGRPQDAAALAAITNRATEDFVRLP